MQKYDPDDTEAVKSQMILQEDTRFIGKYLQKGNLSVGGFRTLLRRQVSRDSLPREGSQTQLWPGQHDALGTGGGKLGDASGCWGPGTRLFFRQLTRLCKGLFPGEVPVGAA